MLKIDGKDFSNIVIINELEEAFELIEGEASTVTQSNRDWYDIVGTKYSHTLSVLRNDNVSQEEWDEFYKVISAPVDFHMVEVDHNQSTIEYAAHIFMGARKLLRVVGGKKIWSDLTLTLTAAEPQRRAE